MIGRVEPEVQYRLFIRLIQFRHIRCRSAPILSPSQNGGYIVASWLPKSLIGNDGGTIGIWLARPFSWDSLNGLLIS
jgi:hypothetical protein